jgi:hypothetical protein
MSRTYVAEEAGSVVGFATWIEVDGTAELEDLMLIRLTQLGAFGCVTRGR